MPLAAKDVIGILSDNLRLRGSVLPIPKRAAIGWALDLNLPRDGETVLYSGLMIQLIPYIEGLVKMEERLGDSFLARFTPLGRRMNRIVNLSAFMARPSARTRAPYDRILADVAGLLQRASVEFGYLYEDDLYTGALAWDLGADEVVAEHAQRVYRTLEKRGVKHVITIDPHTTHMLRTVYPKLIEDYDLRVSSYLELLADKSLPLQSSLSGDVALHDSCIFARFENVTEQPRALLEETGMTIREPQNAGRLTWCCGGPAESLYPEKALAQAKRRVEQLRAVAPEGVTMCPLCLVNLQKAAGETMRFRDISHYLTRASKS
ncbi:MAG: (Fe-S)-binding protein [Gaiellaceae bacterium]|jgi:Fe-S oxidoreductase